jgi:hypothetical protein
MSNLEEYDIVVLGSGESTIRQNRGDRLKGDPGVNFGFLANAVLKKDDAVKAMR